MGTRVVCALALATLCAGRLHGASPTVDAIRKAGELTCGVDQSEAEFSITDEHGSRLAFDRDLCTAVAAAVLGRGQRVVIKGYPDEDTALAALSNHELDMVASVSADFTHSTLPNLSLTSPLLYDVETIMVPRAGGMMRLSSLSGRKICFLSETETEVNLRSWFEQRHLSFVPFPFQEEGEMEAAFATGNCAGIAGDATRLANTRVALAGHAKDFILLPDELADDPLAAAFRSSDPAFANIVKWTFEVLLVAEEQNVTSRNITATRVGDKAPVAKLLDRDDALGRLLGLEDGWTVQVIEAVGNYGEIFRRDLGQGSRLQLARSRNGLRHSLPLK